MLSLTMSQYILTSYRNSCILRYIYIYILHNIEQLKFYLYEYILYDSPLL